MTVPSPIDVSVAPAHPLPTPWRDEPVGHALVYGLGLSGRAAAALLLERGVRVTAVDARPAAALDLDGLEGRPGFALVDGFADASGDGSPASPATAAWESVAGSGPGPDLVVVSPGVPSDRPLLVEARRCSVPVIAEVELAVPFLAGPMVAVTGSNGKSTTTALAGALLAAGGFDARVCGNIGRPLTAAVTAEPAEGVATGAPVAYAVELSSFQLLDTDHLRPRAGALLNLAPDHLDRHGSLAAYTAAKRRLFERQTAEDTAVLNADDPASAATETASRRRFFSLRVPVDDGLWLDGERVIESGDGAEAEVFRRDDLPLVGDHNLANAMAAVLLARAVGISRDDCRTALRAFTGLAHRLERVAVVDGVSFWDDSKATNPAATAGALSGFPAASAHVILGGRGKGTGFVELVAPVERAARRVYLVGEAAEELEAALEEGAGAVPVSRSGTLERAVVEAAERARPGEAVVLSPACASFDQFDDFRHRGREFQRLVENLVGSADRTAPDPTTDNRGGGHGQDPGV